MRFYEENGVQIGGDSHRARIGGGGSVRYFVRV